ncbi:MAG: pyridoxamine 5'-phosphate oxidase family protein [Candidatus Sedimenticola sp. (ex Thyasira tokunagai)]
MNDTEKSIQAARQLLAGRFCGVLATQSLDLPGYPFGSLVPYSLDHQGRPLLLLSHLAKHTRNLEMDPRCSLTLVEPGDGDSQQLARLSCLGRITPSVELHAKEIERHFRYFPQSRPYYEQLNFQFYQLETERYYWVGGFGAARWLDRGRLSYPKRFSVEEEAQLMRTLTAEHSPPRPEATPPQVVGIDHEGIDLLQGDLLQRFPLDHPVTAIDELTRHLEQIKIIK